MFDILLFNWLPPQQQMYVLGAVISVCWVFTCWYYPISNIMDKTKKMKGPYYILLVVFGILPVLAAIAHGLMRSGNATGPRTNMSAPPPELQTQ
jgi:hypothetical protein